MFESMQAILAQSTYQNPGRITVHYDEPSFPLHRMVLNRLRRQRVFENLAADLEEQQALGNLTIRVGLRTAEGGLCVDLNRLVGWLEKAIGSDCSLEEACQRAASSLGNDLARQVGRLLAA